MDLTFGIMFMGLVSIIGALNHSTFLFMTLAIISSSFIFHCNVRTKNHKALHIWLCMYTQIAEFTNEECLAQENTNLKAVYFKASKI